MYVSTNTSPKINISGSYLCAMVDLFGIETTVAQEQVMQLGAALLSLLSTLGVVIDPTTPGVSDSQTVIERK